MDWEWLKITKAQADELGYTPTRRRKLKLHAYRASQVNPALIESYCGLTALPRNKLRAPIEGETVCLLCSAKIWPQIIEARLLPPGWTL